MRHGSFHALRARSTAAILIACALSAAGAAQDVRNAWRHSGTFFILTTPDGADLPAAARETDFPLLLRLSRENFDFAQAKDDGADLRFSDGAGAPLAYEIEQWDRTAGTASIWVRIPAIAGNARQAITMYWGNAAATSASNGGAVFNAANGFATVMHLGETLADEVGTLAPVDAGSTAAEGVIGKGRHCEQGRGINGGDHVTSYPFGDQPFTSELWARGERAGTQVFGWGRYATRLNGNTGDGNEVVISLNSPPSFGWGSDGPGGAASRSLCALGKWYHVAASYCDGMSRIYVNGALEGSNEHRAAMSIVKDIGVTLGGLRGSYNFAGTLDEVRVSRVARSADWIKLEYENQKPLQTLVGPLVQPGGDFAVTPAELALAEGGTAKLEARAGGAQKIYWTLERDGARTVVAVDRFAYTFEAGRIAGDTTCVLELEAVFPNEVKTKRISVAIEETIPEPVVTLRAPAAWNGRDTIEVVPAIANMEAMRAQNAGNLRYRWRIAGGAVIKEVLPDRLRLLRSQSSATLAVTLALDNGGAETLAATSIAVAEPASDPWVERIPDKDEKPEENQFYARNDKNEGTLFYNGTLDAPADAVFLRLYADDMLVATERRTLGADRAYAFAVTLTPALIKYKVEFGSATGGVDKVLRTVGNLVCGDAYLIDGQSNAEALGPNNGPDEDPVEPINDWIRSYGNQLDGSTACGWGNAVRMHIWGKPNCGHHQIGAWGMVLAKGLVAAHRIPICIINGAVGGSPIWTHQPHPTDRHFVGDEWLYTLYGRLLNRVTAARLTHGIRGVLWHQGENDSGSGAPTGDYNYKSYQQDFINLAAAWKQDYPNITHYYVFQVWPLPCCMGPTDDELREAQRTLPRLFSNLRVMSTLGIASPATGRGMCHYDLEGYRQMAELIRPLVEQDNYDVVPPREITAPNLVRARFTSAAKDEVALDFGQPMAWNDGAKRSFYLDGAVAPIAAGAAAGNVVTLTLSAPSSARTITYIRGRDWDGKPASLLFGANGIAALTFCQVPIEAPATMEPRRPSE